MKTNSVKLKIMGGLLLFAVLFYSCSSDDPTVVIDKSALTTGIATASALVASTVEGTAAGQFQQGAQAVLQTAIDAAQAVASNAVATQAEVTNAAVSLAAAVTVYEGKIIEAIDPANLVGHWTFDEIASVAAEAVVKDYSGNSHDGAIKQGHEYWGGGLPALAEDRYGNANKALHFDEGSNVEVPYNTSLNTQILSVSLWAKADVNEPIINNQYMVSMNRWNGYKLQFQDSPKAFFTVKADVDGSPDPAYYDRDNASPLVTQGKWWHIVVTFGDGHMMFYLDGILVKDWDNTPGTAISQSASPVNLIFGQDLPSDGYSLNEADPNYLNWGGFYIGALDEVRLYKSVLSASQITSIYDLEKP